MFDEGFETFSFHPTRTGLCTKIAPPPVRVQGLVLVLILVLLLGFCAISIAFLLAASKMMADGLSNSLTHSLSLSPFFLSRVSPLGVPISRIEKDCSLFRSLATTHFVAGACSFHWPTFFELSLNLKIIRRQCNAKK
jgi:hypothetical protein